MLDYKHDNLNPFVLYCPKHTNMAIQFGCTEYECDLGVIMCQKCVEDDKYHQLEHKGFILPIEQYIETTSNEIRKTLKPFSVNQNANFRAVFEKEQLLIKNFEDHINGQRRKLESEVDEIVRHFVHHARRIRDEIRSFLTSQIDIFKGNCAFYKEKYKNFNPEDVYLKYSTPNFLRNKLLMRSPVQAASFLRNLRQTANMEEKLLNSLIFISDKIIYHANNPPTISDEMYADVKEQTFKLIDLMNANLYESCVQVPRFNEDFLTSTKSNTVSHARKAIRLDRMELLNKNSFTIEIEKTIQTNHNNSICALVAIAEDYLATSSYDRTIKIWKVSEGAVIKTLFDKNSVCSMILFKISTDVAEDSTGLTEAQLKNYSHQIIRNPEMTLSKLGFFLVTGGFDKVLKIWDFPLKRDETPGYPTRELPGHSNWVTSILSLEDGENVVSGDDNGELIVWDILFGKQKQKITVMHKTVIMCLTLIKKFKKFASASADTIRIWNINYKETEGVKKISIIECCCSFNNNGLVLSMLSPINHENLLIIGSRDGALRFLDIEKRELIMDGLQGKEFIGDMLLIEKSLKMLDAGKNYFNILSLSNGLLRVHNHDGAILSTLGPANHEDFSSSNILPNRAMSILKIHHNSREFVIKIGIASQYASQYFNFKSSRITIVNVKIKNF